MKPTHPLPVHHSWALYERERHFELGQVHGYDTLDSLPDASRFVGDGGLMRARPGYWECDLDQGNRLSWSGEVYDIFGIPRGAPLVRDETAALYGEGSRAAMEKLRAYAIRHGRGFTLDVEILPAQGARRWMRLIAAPQCISGRVARLQGLKFLVPAG